MRKGAPDLESAIGFLDPADPMGSGMQMLQYMAGMAMVGDDGSFSLEGVDPGEYEVRVYTADTHLDDIDPEEFLNMPIEEMQQRSQEFAPKEVLRQPITVADKPITVEFTAAKEAAP
ncbi:MAG: hypothetical protein FJY92_10135 [Candidatus Hydrogenedentes bacterium]|nr:hypothetical protein [Candidatus Hydrogenedentota bacterium]